MRKPDFNGPACELPRGTHHSDEEVYCVNCGNVYVYVKGRDCPTCTIAEMLEEQGVTVDA